MNHPSPATAFAPASIGNVGVGFDVLGLAVGGDLGDTVTASPAAHDEIRITRITTVDDTTLPTDPTKNTAAVAARATLDAAGVSIGIDLELHKGLPVGSGLGSSAASAAAAALATNLLIGSPLRKSQLIEPCLDAEAAVAGRHADNVAASLLGGLILARSIEPLDVVRLPIPQGLHVAVITPKIEILTRDSRAVLPESVPLAELVQASAAIASFVSACHSGDLSLLARALRQGPDVRARLPLIPGAPAAIDAALDNGALGASISGAGPSLFAMARSESSARRIASAMQAALESAGLEASSHVAAADARGARRA